MSLVKRFYAGIPLLRINLSRPIQTGDLVRVKGYPGIYRVNRSSPHMVYVDLNRHDIWISRKWVRRVWWANLKLTFNKQ